MQRYNPAPIRDARQIGEMEKLGMHTVELLREAFSAAERLGYKLRLENLAGTNGGVCIIAGRKHLFVELAQSPAEQLEVVLAALRDEPATAADPRWRANHKAA